LKSTSKRLLALVAGGLGLGAVLGRRRQSAPSPSPADELKAKLAVAKEPEPAPAPEPVPVVDGVDERRADTHARARHAIEELREKSE
jgi:hypothetical protein